MPGYGARQPSRYMIVVTRSLAFFLDGQAHPQLLSVQSGARREMMNRYNALIPFPWVQFYSKRSLSRGRKKLSRGLDTEL